MKVLLVANPTAQSGKAEARIQVVLDAMKARGWQAEFLATLPEGKTVPALRDRISGEAFDVVVYMGGDGTFREVAKGILAAGAEHHMGMLPSGTANDQGKSFGVSSKADALEKNLEIIEARHVLALDVGVIQRLDEQGHVTHEDRFFDSAGWGFQADILRVRNQDRHTVEGIPGLRNIYRDQAVYAGAGIKRTVGATFKKTKFKAHITADGGVHEFSALFDVIINATPIYGGSWVPMPDARPDDGFFELVPMKGRRDTASKLLRDLAHLPLHQKHLDPLGLKHSEGFGAQRFELRFERPSAPDIAAQIDGEEWMSGRHFRVKVLRRRLRLIIPQWWTPPWVR